MPVNNKEIKGEVKELRLVTEKDFLGTGNVLRSLNRSTFRVTSWDMSVSFKTQ